MKCSPAHRLDCKYKKKERKKPRDQGLVACRFLLRLWILDHRANAFMILSLVTNREREKSCAVLIMSRGTMLMRAKHGRKNKVGLVALNVLPEGITLTMNF